MKLIYLLLLSVVTAQYFKPSIDGSFLTEDEKPLIRLRRNGNKTPPKRFNGGNNFFEQRHMSIKTS